MIHDDIKTMERIRLLHPAVRPLATAHAKMCWKKDIRLRITQGLRTIAEQDELYALGRTKPGKVVTNAKGGQSWHNYGLAYDITILRYDLAAKKTIATWNTESDEWIMAIQIGKDAGMRHGIKVGKWIDMPHFELTFGLTLEQAKFFWDNGLINYTRF